jgi:AcrR family transcriptional regulator
MRRKDDEKQKNIKEAVIKLILKEGFHGTSISKIAKEAGVSPATVYIYYENKDMMLQDIIILMLSYELKRMLIIRHAG